MHTGVQFCIRNGMGFPPTFSCPVFRGVGGDQINSGTFQTLTTAPL